MGPAYLRSGGCWEYWTKEQMAKASERLRKAKQQFQKTESCWDDDHFIEALKQRPLEESQ